MTNSVQESTANSLRTVLSGYNWIFNLFLAVCSLIGVLAIAGAIFWKSGYYEHQREQMMFQIGRKVAEATAAKGTTQSGALPPSDTRALEQEIATLLKELAEPDHPGPDLLRDLGIALLISVFVTLVIEQYASNRLREHITYDVLSAAYAKVVPEKIYRQIADSVFRSDVYREKWEVHVRGGERLVDPHGSQIALLHSLISYDVRNLNDHPIRFEVTGGIDIDILLVDRLIPRFRSIAVADENDRPLVRESISDHEAKVLLSENPPGHPLPLVRKGDLTLRREGQQIGFAASVRIPSRGSVRVTFEVERTIRVPGNFVLYATVPADGIKIAVSGNNGFTLAVLALHPNREALRQLAGNVWEFDCGILPWQGFQLRSEIKEAT